MSDDQPVTDYDVESGTFPAELLARERWFVWALDNDRKIPRAPWANPDHTERYVSWKDESMWTDFEEASDWVDKVPTFGHASCIPTFEDNSVERIIFFDFDDVRDPETGAIHPHAWQFVQAQGLHAAISTSGTGVHGFGWGSVPDGYKPSFERELPDWEYTETPELEVYASARFMALTGEHIAGTPVGLPDLGDTAHELFLRFGSERVTGTEREPDISREELADVDTTTDVEDIYDAIAHTRPRDIRLRSTKTNERADGTVNRDPSWANSKSGTRLAEFEDHWLYRKGNHRLDALQVVALEERIITDEGEYPSGQDFRDAVDALRDRGAHIPELEVRRKKPTLDVVKEANGERDPAAEAAAVVADGESPGGEPAGDSSDQPAETDGGASVETPGESQPLSKGARFSNEVVSAISLLNDEEVEIAAETVRHRIASAFLEYYDFAKPEEEVPGWRATLYVYNDDEGVYEPRGEEFIGTRLEAAAADWTTNQRVREVKGKIERKATLRADEINDEPFKLVVGNGVLDLRTGTLEPYTPTEYHTTKIDTNWVEDAECPEIDDFLHSIVEDKDVTTLYRLIAHTLPKEYIGEKAAMLLGDGQNGKTIFLNMIERFIHTENVSHRELQDLSYQFAGISLLGKHANIAGDMSGADVNDLSDFKKLTGGDKYEADVKGEASVEFYNYATMLFSANEMPVFHEDNRGVWRRWIYLNFPYTFDGDDPDARDPIPKRVLMQRITDESEFEGLLYRCQQEIQEWWEDRDRDFFAGVLDPDEVRDKMKRAAEPIFNFASVCLEPDDDPDDDEAWLRKREVRKCYREYASAEGLPKINEDQFGKRLVNLIDFPIESKRKRVDGTRQYVYTGVRFSARGRQVLGLDDPDDGQSQMGDTEQATRLMLNKMRELVDANDGEPIAKDMVVGACMSQLGTTTARNAFQDLKTNGEVFENNGGWLPSP